MGGIREAEKGDESGSNSFLCRPEHGETNPSREICCQSCTTLGNFSCGRVSVTCTVCTLSRRQWEFLKLVAVGATDSQIAVFLYISPHTVRDYFKQLFSYTGLRNRTQLAALALRYL